MTADGQVSNLTVSTIESYATLEPMIGQWDKLLLASSANNIFLTAEWLTAWWESYGAGKQLEIVLVTDEHGQLVGLAPFCISRRRWLGPLYVKELGFLGTGAACSDYLDVIVARCQDTAVLGNILLYTRDVLDWDILMLSDIPEASGTVVRCICTGLGFDWTEVRPGATCLYVPLPQDWDSYLASLAKDFRKEIAYYRRRLEREFAVEFRVAETKEEALRMLEALVGLHKRWWATRGMQGNMGDSILASFHREMIGRYFDRGWFQLHALTVDGRTIGVLYGFKYAGKFYYYNSGLDPDYASHSPGTVLIGHCIKAAIEEGLFEFDFIRGTSPYKYRWGCVARRSLQLRAYRSALPGRLRRCTDVLGSFFRWTGRRIMSKGVTLDAAPEGPAHKEQEPETGTG